MPPNFAVLVAEARTSDPQKIYWHLARYTGSISPNTLEVRLSNLRSAPYSIITYLAVVERSNRTEETPTILVWFFGVFLFIERKDKKPVQSVGVSARGASHLSYLQELPLCKLTDDLTTTANERMATSSGSRGISTTYQR